MAAPTITNISPNRIYTGGQMITVTGTGFQTRYPIPPETPHPWPTPNPTVAVTIDGRPAKRVVVYSPTTLTCITASHDPGAAAVTVQNLNSSGSPISGESATATSLLEFVRADLTATSDLARVIEALVSELKRQVIENVSTTTSVDFDSDPEAVVFAGVDIAETPALCLTGPVLARNRLYGTDRPVEETDDGFARRSTFEPQDLNFRLLGLDNHGLRSINLQALVTQFFKNNITLVLDRDPDAPSKGQVSYELEGGPFESVSTNNDNDSRAFSGPVTIKGFLFEDVIGFNQQSVVEHTTEVEDFDVVQTAFPAL